MLVAVGVHSLFRLVFNNPVHTSDLDDKMSQFYKAMLLTSTSTLKPVTTCIDDFESPLQEFFQTQARKLCLVLGTNLSQTFAHPDLIFRREAGISKQKGAGKENKRQRENDCVNTFSKQARPDIGQSLPNCSASPLASVVTIATAVELTDPVKLRNCLTETTEDFYSRIIDQDPVQYYSLPADEKIADETDPFLFDFSCFEPL